MRPITFSCTDTLALSAADIARRIIDLANWTDFTGYAVLRGIRAAEYEVRTPAVVGSNRRVFAAAWQRFEAARPAPIVRAISSDRDAGGCAEPRPSPKSAHY